MEFFFREYGSGRPLIILHGYLGLSDYWINVAKYFSTQNYNVIVPDIPLFGRSFHLEEFSYEEIANILIFLCKEKKLKNPILMGHSMGGKIAMTMQRISPSYFKALIVVDIHFKKYPLTKENKILCKELLNLNFSSFNRMSDISNYLLSKGIDRDMCFLILKNIKTIKGKFSWRAAIPILARDFPKVLSNIDVKQTSIPTLLLKGENSNYINNEDEKKFNKIYINSSIINVPNSGHWIQRDNPAFLINEVIKFLSI
ncbi:MAG: alpha/beta hydrolase [Bacteroidales bacterium]|jgi:pimeloyl-ACP methyl ester carboxylesterase|nr:alpha/beta hydrolase [Bacteroidales bacterium]